MPARGNEKRPTSHGWIDHTKAEDLGRALSLDDRVERLLHEKRAHPSRRVERGAGFSDLPGACEHCRLIDARLVLEHLFVDGAELLDVELAVADWLPTLNRREP